MKVALVNPRLESWASVLPPLGLLYIGAVLEKEGLDVRIFDISPNNEREMTAEVVGFRPDIVGLTVVTIHAERARQVILSLRRHLNSMFVIGGVHATALPRESLELFSPDCLVLGEGEETMKELCLGRALADVNGIAYRKNGSMVKTGAREPIACLDDIPFPARHLIDFQRYLFPPGAIRGYWSERCTSVMTSRGCPFQCIWCGTQTTFGRRVRRRSVDNVIAEIKSLQRDYHIDSIWFVDDTFTLDRSWVIEFCHKLQEEKIKLKWDGNAHVTTIDAELVEVMKKAGLVQLDFGVESGSERVLKALKKNSTPQAIRRAFDIAKKAGVRTMASFMFGNPEEGEEDVKATFELAREIRPNFVSAFFLTPFPGTELMETAKDKGWLAKDYSFGGFITREPLLKINFSSSQLHKIRKDFQRQFLWTNFASFFLDLRTLSKMLWIVLCYPKGLLKGMSVFLKTGVFDDLVFNFLVYYAEEKKRGKSYAGRQ